MPQSRTYERFGLEGCEALCVSIDVSCIWAANEAVNEVASASKLTNVYLEHDLEPKFFTTFHQTPFSHRQGGASH